MNPLDATMNEAPLLTIGIPCRNEASFIGECIASLVKQNVESSFRVVVSDNNSQDETVSIVENMISINDNLQCEIVLIRGNEDISAGQNFKRVFDYAESTPYFMWLGAHDALSETFVRDGMQIMQTDEGCSMASGAPYAISPSATGDEYSIPRLMEDAIYNYSQEDPIHRYLLSAIRTSNCTVFHSIFRRLALSGYSWQYAPSADHIIISRLLWFGRLRYFKGAYIRRYFTRDIVQRKRLSGKYVKNTSFFDAYVSDFYKLLAAGHSDFVAQTFTKALFEILLDRYGYPSDATWPRSFGAVYGGKNARFHVLSLGKSHSNKGNDLHISQGGPLQRCLAPSQPPSIAFFYYRYVLRRLKEALALGIRS